MSGTAAQIDLDAARHMHEDFVRATSSGTTPGAVLADLPDDVAGVVDTIMVELRSGRTRYAVDG